MMKILRNIAVAILLALAILMLYIGIVNTMVPPALTGVGFLVIAFMFLSNKQ